MSTAQTCTVRHRSTTSDEVHGAPFPGGCGAQAATVVTSNRVAGSNGRERKLRRIGSQTDLRVAGSAAKPAGSAPTTPRMPEPVPAQARFAPRVPRSRAPDRLLRAVARGSRRRRRKAAEESGEGPNAPEFRAAAARFARFVGARSKKTVEGRKPHSARQPRRTTESQAKLRDFSSSKRTAAAPPLHFPFRSHGERAGRPGSGADVSPFHRPGTRKSRADPGPPC